MDLLYYVKFNIKLSYNQESVFYLYYVAIGNQ